MRVKLLNPYEVEHFFVYTGYMAAVCYDTVDYNRLPPIENIMSELYKRYYRDDFKRLEEIGRKCIKAGHYAPTRGFTFKFYIEGISRNCSHQLVRHSVGFYPNQLSQRHVLEEDFGNYVTPSSLWRCRENVVEIYRKAMYEIWNVYQTLIEAGVPIEDARYVLPGAWQTKLTVAMTWEALLNFMHQRLCWKAQWEIQQLAVNVKNSIIEILPTLGDYFIPKCEYLRGCPEEKSCGYYKKRQENRT